MVNTTYWTTCDDSLEQRMTAEEPLWKGFTFHHFGLFLSAVFGGIACVVALFLVFQHATHYSRPYEQRHIIRILLMIPVYAVVSFLSCLFYTKAVYFEVLRDCYEAFAIASFFTLLCHYVAPNLHDQKEYFRALKPVNWFWGVFGLQYCTGGQNKGPFRLPRSGLTWFNIIWIGVFQYCFIRVLFTIVSVITQEFDRYCEASLSPAFAHIWVLVFEVVSVTIAMFCLIQFYIQLRVDLAEHKPFLKVLCIKLVIFFSFWQTILISFLSSDSGPLQPSKRISYQDIKVGIPSVMLCIEMSIFAVMHLFAFPWKEYSLEPKHKNGAKNSDPLHMTGAGFSGQRAEYQGGPLGLAAMVDAFNPWDIVKASARGFRWLFVGYKKRTNDPSYQSKVGTMDGATSYLGPTYAGTGGAATELRPGRDPRADTLTAEPLEDDRAGLLRNSANMSGGRQQSASPYRTNTQDSYGEQADLSAPGQRLQPAPAGYKGNDFAAGRPSEWDDEDTGYHPGMGPSTSASPPSAGYHAGPMGMHPALQGQGVQQWDMWAAAGGQRPHGLDPEAESIRPPTYRTQDPHR